MEINLTFTLPDEQHLLDDALDGGKWRNVVEDIDNKLRGIVKYNTDGHSEEYTRVTEEIRMYILDKLHDYKLSLFE